MNAAEFDKAVEIFQKSGDYKEPIAFGIARLDRAKNAGERVLQATYAHVNYRENYKSAAAYLNALKLSGEACDVSGAELIASVSARFINEALNLFEPFIDEAEGDRHRNVQVLLSLAEIGAEQSLSDYRVAFLFADEAPKTVEAVYLKLYALSLGKAALRSLNLDGAFGILPNVAWAGGEPIDLDWLRENEIDLKLRGEFPNIDYVDKFPRYLRHIIPSDNTRILDGSKVRFGAHLAAGTTVMPGASYVNFNAGTTGACMVEGRISSGAVVGAGSDIGGGASILGVLSGTSGKPVTIGKNTLLGANSVTGVPLGDGCIVDAGIAVLEGAKIAIDAKEAIEIAKANPSFHVSGEQTQIVKGADLAGLHGIHYRVNSQTGRMQAFRSKREVKLNADLH
ncbi:MAG: tetrahydrodipicolinate N-succinyltransferase N-terminal domain-containing protein [Helicobacteraceae bacterium]|jgi:2,3,4,5-tetrahydropyridine-2-carboxylate N-succinyltransferase|nr:tetrahydrodipicolinate N-succinyltransferase N-terminal domain-containing protein [Helicobacteraceae bacterium]